LAAERDEMTMDEPGKFGLPISPFDPRSEPASSRKKRIASVNSLVFEVFNLAKAHLGEKKAQKLFVGVTHRKKMGRRAAVKENAELLRLYDEEVAKNPMNRKSAPRQIAEYLYNRPSKRFGQSVDALTKRIRRQVAARKKGAILELEHWEAMRQADGKYPGLLGDWVVEKLKERISKYCAK
jgi:hypothetical protein